MDRSSCFGVFGALVGPQTCMQCRQRKVRCDKRQGACGNCERLNLTCYTPHDNFATNDGSSHSTTPSFLERDGMLRRRLRAAKACSACKLRKIRCSGTTPSCVSCKERGRACVYPTPKRQFRRNHGTQFVLEIPEPTTPSNIDDTVGPYIGSPENSVMPQDVDAQPPASNIHTSNIHTSNIHTSNIHTSNIHTSNIHTSNIAVSPAESPESLIYQGHARRNLTVPTWDVLNGFISFFFEVLYPMPSYAFLHPGTTKKRCYSRKKSCSLSLAICAVASVHMKDQPEGALMSIPYARMQERATSWAQAAEQSIWLQLGSPTITRLQTLLLVIHYHMETANFPRAFMLIATAARYAAAMRLNHERQHVDRIAQEVGRRTLWSLKIVERYFSVGLAEFDMLPIEAIYIEFPQKEEEFLGSGQDSLQGQAENGAYGLFTQLEVVRRDIMRLARNVTLLEEPLANLAELIDHHRRMIAGMKIPPPPLQNSDSMGSEDPFGDHWLPRRVLARISWHQTHCDLYRILLPGYSEAAPKKVLQDYDSAELTRAEELCSHHAMCIIDIITTLNQHSDRRHLLEFDTAICAYHATRLILYISRLGHRRNRLSPEFALSRAQLCLAALKRFFFASALVAPMIRELEQSIVLFSTQQQRQRFQHGRFNSSTITSQGREQEPSRQNSAVTINRSSHDLAERDERSVSNQSTDKGQGRHLSSAAQVRQRLAIHSLLRRADFAEDDDEEDKEEENEAPPRQQEDLAFTTRDDVNPSRMTEHNQSNPITSPGKELRRGSTQQSNQAHSEPNLNTHSPASAIIPMTATSQDTYRRDFPHSGLSAQSHYTQPSERSQPAASTVISPTTLDTLTPSTASDQDMVDMVMSNKPWVPGDIELSIFSWWSSQDWGWLSDRAEIQ